MKRVPSIAFIICSEKGTLEKKSVLFAESLRKFGGSLKDCPIYSLAPRKGNDISEATKKAFNQLGVFHQALDLNQKYRDYGFANKIVTAAYFEKSLSERELIFCDSDQLVLNDLSELILHKEDISMQHVAIKGIGSNGSDVNASYWKALYKLLKVSEPKLIKINEDELIFPYFNAGLIAVKRKVGLFNKWSQNFDLIMEKKIRPKQGNFFLEQSVLSATIMAMQLKLKVLPKGYNFHLLKQTIPADAIKKIENEDIQLLHYHSAFNEGKVIELTDELNLKKSTRLNWLNQTLIDLGINKKPFISQLELQFWRHRDSLKAKFQNLDKTNKS